MTDHPTDETSDPPQDPRPYLEQVERQISKFGHAVVGVFDHEHAGVTFSYTAGLTPVRGYELFISGLPATTAQTILNDTAHTLADRVPAQGLTLPGLLGGGYELRLRLVQDPSPLNVVRALYGRTPTVWQVVYPDDQHRFPGDPGYSVPPDVQLLI